MFISTRGVPVNSNINRGLCQLPSCTIVFFTNNHPILVWAISLLERFPISLKGPVSLVTLRKLSFSITVVLLLARSKKMFFMDFSKLGIDRNFLFKISKHTTTLVVLYCKLLTAYKRKFTHIL